MADESGTATVDNRAERASALRAEADALEAELAESVNEVVQEAEETVSEVAETVAEEAHEAHETASEAEEQVEEAVSEAAEEAADELGHPELAGHIADELFRRLDERGILPHNAHHSTQPITEQVEEVAADPVETTHAEAETVTRDVAPEAGHWWYRPVRLRRSR